MFHVNNSWVYALLLSGEPFETKVSFGSEKCTLSWVSLVADCATAFHDSAADDWRWDAVFDGYEDVHGDAETDIFNTDWCVEPYEDPDYAGDNVKVWSWNMGWVELNVLSQKTTLPEFRGKGCGIASRIESIDFKEMSITLENHVERQKLEGQEQASGGRELEDICGFSLTFDNSDKGGMNKDVRHKCFEKIQAMSSGKDFAGEYSEGIQHERFGNDDDEECKTLF